MSDLRSGPASITILSEFRAMRDLAIAGNPHVSPTDRNPPPGCASQRSNHGYRRGDLDATGNLPAGVKPAGLSLQRGDEVFDRLTRSVCRVTFVEPDADGNAARVWLVRRTAPHGTLGQSRPASMVERLVR